MDTASRAGVREPHVVALGSREMKAALVAASKGPDQTLAMKGRPGDGAAEANAAAMGKRVILLISMNAMRELRSSIG
jgi:hypothetical protein